MSDDVDNSGESQLASMFFMMVEWEGGVKAISLAMTEVISAQEFAPEGDEESHTDDGVCTSACGIGVAGDAGYKEEEEPEADDETEEELDDVAGFVLGIPQAFGTSLGGCIWIFGGASHADTVGESALCAIFEVFVFVVFACQGLRES